MALTDGQLLGPYEILGVLGAGGMGEVYRARDTRLDREVAIKVLPEMLSKDAEALTRFEREAKAVAALSHPNILALHDVSTDGDGPAYAVMELLSGETLGAALEHGPLPPRKAVEIAGQVARGLGSAHDGGVVHRDIKPDNLFLAPDGRVKILDFGLAALTGFGDVDTSASSATLTSLTSPGTVMGTINYMSPEQARGAAAGAASDIFSLGSVLYEMLTGRKPFERETAPETMTAILREDPPEIDRDGVSPSVARIVQRCLEKVPEQRVRTRGHVADLRDGSLGGCRRRSTSSGSTRLVGAGAARAGCRRVDRRVRPQSAPTDDGRGSGEDPADHLLGTGRRPGDLPERPDDRLSFGTWADAGDLDQAARSQRRGPSDQRLGQSAAVLARRNDAAVRAAFRPGGGRYLQGLDRWR
jgi:serine/threonine protein kinase